MPAGTLGFQLLSHEASKPARKVYQVVNIHNLDGTERKRKYDSMLPMNQKC